MLGDGEYACLGPPKPCHPESRTELRVSGQGVDSRPGSTNVFRYPNHPYYENLTTCPFLLK